MNGQRVLGAGFVAVLMVAAPGSAHGPTHAPGYISTVIEIRPAVLGLSAMVLGGDELLSLRNWSNRTVVVLGPDGRPMFRFADNRVYRPVADGWRLLKRGTGHSWHDSRIHWNGPTPPAAVVDAPERDHSIAPWRIPTLVDGQRVVIRGGDRLGGATDRARRTWRRSPGLGRARRGRVLRRRTRRAGVAVRRSDRQTTGEGLTSLPRVSRSTASRPGRRARRPSYRRCAPGSMG